MSFCYHCMTRLDSPDMPFCPECGQKHNFHKAQSHELPAGTMLNEDRYFVGECLAADDFDLVYIGYDLKMNRKVIIKEIYYKNIFSRNSSESLNVSYDDRIVISDIMKQISRECISLSESDALTNVNKVYDWFTANNTAYIVCEYVSETSLSDRAAKIGGYEWDKLYALLKPLLQSLSALHEKNLYHKNIKPANIMIRKTLSGEDEFVLSNFGFGRRRIEGGADFEGSTPFEPVEQRNHAQDDGDYTDIYSTAATIYYAVTGNEPIDKLSKNIDDVFPLLRPYRKSKQLPENVYYALKYALQPDFNARCPSVETFIKRLETVQKPVTVKSGPAPKMQVPDHVLTTYRMPTASPTVAAESPSEKKPPVDYVPNMVNDTPMSVPPQPTQPTQPTQPAQQQGNSSQTNQPQQRYASYAGNPNPAQQTAMPDENKQSKDKNNIGLIIALTVVSCLLLIGIIVGIVVIATRNSDDKRGPGPEPERTKASENIDAENEDEDNEVSESDEKDENADTTSEKADGLLDIGGRLAAQAINGESKEEDDGNNGEDEDEGEENNDNESSESDELDEFEDDAENLSDYINEYINSENPDGDTTLHMLCNDNQIFDDEYESYYSRIIDGVEYYMVWVTEENSVKLSGGEFDYNGIQISGDTTISELADSLIFDNQ